MNGFSMSKSPLEAENLVSSEQEPRVETTSGLTKFLRPNGRVFPFGSMELWPNRTPKRVRAYARDMLVADSEDVILLHEQGLTPVYYFPQNDIRMEHLRSLIRKSSRCPRKGHAQYFTFADGPYAGKPVAWAYDQPVLQASEIEGRIAFYWDRIDRWFEDSVEIFGSPPDPFVRIEITSASAPVRVVHKGVLVAETVKALVLYETGLIPRFYIPETDIRATLIASETKTACTYKGVADYAHVATDALRVEDGAFGYLNPIHESAPLAGHWSLYFEKFDATFLGDTRLLTPSAQDDGRPLLVRGDKLGQVVGTK